MELVRFDAYGGQLGVGDHNTLRIRVEVQVGMYRESALGPGAGNEIDDNLMTDQGLPPPVHRDEGEHAVLDLVPLARAWREVTHADVQPSLAGETAQLEFPQAHPMPVATAAAVGGDREFARLGVARLAHRVPPPPDRLHRKRGRVVVRSD